MSGPSRGLQDWAAEHVPADSPKRKETVRARRRQRQPDQDRATARRSSCSTAPTCRGPTAASTWCRARRACSRAIRIASTSKGAARRISGQEAPTLLAEFEHPLWKEIAAQAQGAGHGGMDFIEDYRLIKCLREGTPTDINVYDAAALSAVVRAERAVGRQASGAGRLSGLHARPLEDQAAAADRPHVTERAQPASDAARAVVLARGLGTRMREPDPAARAERRRSSAPPTPGSKMMIPVHGRPFLDYVLSALADAGITRRRARGRAGSRRDRARTTQRAPAGARAPRVRRAARAARHGQRRPRRGGVGRRRALSRDERRQPVSRRRARARWRRSTSPACRRSSATIWCGPSNIPAERVHAFALVEVDDEGYLTAIVEKPGSDRLPDGRASSARRICWSA